MWGEVLRIAASIRLSITLCDDHILPWAPHPQMHLCLGSFPRCFTPSPLELITHHILQNELLKHIPKAALAPWEVCWRWFSRIHSALSLPLIATSPLVLALHAVTNLDHCSSASQSGLYWLSCYSLRTWLLALPLLWQYRPDSRCWRGTARVPMLEAGRPTEPVQAWAGLARSQQQPSRFSRKQKPRRLHLWLPLSLSRERKELSWSMYPWASSGWGRIK